MAKIIGVTTQTYLKWENGIYEPKATQIKNLAELLEITEIEICRGYLFKETEYYDVLAFIQEIDSMQFLSDIDLKEIIYKNIYDKKKFFIDLENKQADNIAKMERRKEIRIIENKSRHINDGKIEITGELIKNDSISKINNE